MSCLMCLESTQEDFIGEKKEMPGILAKYWQKAKENPEREIIIQVDNMSQKPS